MSKTIRVIGGGVAGLSAAIRLAYKGFDVSLYEQNRTLGGKMNRLTMQGYQFDTGPSLITMPFVIEELFDSVGEKITDYMNFIPIDPICRYFFPDQTVFDAWAGREKMIAELERSFPNEVDHFNRFMAYSARIYKNTANVFLFSPIHEWPRLINLKNLLLLMRLYQIDPFRTVHQAVSRFFDHPYLIQLFDRYATYNGSDPYRAPATLNTIPHVEYALKSFYVSGGIYALTEALATLARRVGVSIYTNTRVEKILQKQKRVTAIRIDGETIDTDAVVCNSDVVVTYNDLLSDLTRQTCKLNQLEPSLSGLVFFWGVNKSFPRLKQHNIIFSDDYAEEFDQIFQQKVPPDDPTIYIAVTSKKDPQHAPSGGENWFVLLNMPYLTSNDPWDMTVSRMRQQVLTKLKKAGIDAAAHIECEKVMTPLDIRDKFSSNCGSIYGLSSNSMTAAFSRPANRNRDLKGLYFAGGSVHPGGGVPLCMLSGKMAAELVVEYEK